MSSILNLLKGEGDRKVIIRTWAILQWELYIYKKQQPRRENGSWINSLQGISDLYWAICIDLANLVTPMVIEPGNPLHDKSSLLGRNTLQGILYPLRAIADFSLYAQSWMLMRHTSPSIAMHVLQQTVFIPS